MPRNPSWTRDELILALDLYFRINPVYASKDDAAIRELSDLLNALPVHTERPDGDRFRNPNGVYMKLCNFLRLDPSYKGVGLSRGGHLEEDIWREFAADRPRLEATARAIKLASRFMTSAGIEKSSQSDGEDEEFTEGRVLTILHRRRERSRAAVAQKKKQVLDRTGALECEVCGFDFERVYGAMGSGFAECHHTVPLCDLGDSTRMRLSDLAIVCANCHRMLHRSRPMFSVVQLRAMIREHV
jgi:5-methylcytosine-specific restriction protein A